MTIQSGFDGIKILPTNDGTYALDDMRAILESTGTKYRGYVAALEYADNESSETFWRLVFAILSVHSPIGATFAAYRRLRLRASVTERMPARARLASLIGTAHADDGVILYSNQKATYIKELEHIWRTSPETLTRNGDDDDAYRWRIQRNVRGLGIAKASFAVALTAPSTSDVCCVDTHMCRIFTGKRPTGAISKTLYLDIESRIRSLASEYGLSTFCAQWCLWDAARGVSNPHAGLRVSE